MKPEQLDVREVPGLGQEALRGAAGAITGFFLSRPDARKCGESLVWTGLPAATEGYCHQVDRRRGLHHQAAPSRLRPGLGLVGARRMLRPEGG
jgi:hypothetical protein